MPLRNKTASIHAGTHPTWMRYLFSYILLLAALLLGFTLIVRSQLKTIYSEDFLRQTQEYVCNYNNILNIDFGDLNHIEYQLLEDDDLMMLRYTDSGEENYPRYFLRSSRVLMSYSDTSSLIDSIVYVDFNHQRVLTSGRYAFLAEDGLHILANGRYLRFQLQDCLSGMTKNSLLYLQEDDVSLLLYIPYNHNIVSYSFFFILDLSYLDQFLKDNTTVGIESLCLTDSDWRIISGTGSELMDAFLPWIAAGDYAPRVNAIPYEISGLQGQYHLVALFSDQVMRVHVDGAFRNTYLLLLLIAAAGFFLIMFSMRFTYMPLYRLARKFLPRQPLFGDYIEQLNTVFTDISSENLKLQRKIGSYRLTIQKSLLNSALSDNVLFEEDAAAIDRLFGMEQGNYLFLVKVSFSAPGDSGDYVHELKMSLDKLSGAVPSILFQKGEDYAIFLVHCACLERDKGKSLHQLLRQLSSSEGCLCAVSEPSASPLDIPALYEQVNAAAQMWPGCPVAVYREVRESLPSEVCFAYPYDLLEKLAAALSCHDPAAGHEITDRLFALLESTPATDNPFPEFFTRCVLIDLLTAIVTAMNHINVRFKSYGELYFSTLYLCRSCPYERKKDEIYENIQQLLDCYEEEYASLTDRTGQIRQFILDNYTSPDFSVTALAQRFDMNDSYMSSLFKEKFGVNFSEYLWNLRMERAKELLLHTDKSIEDISVSVGYLNTSSFRRKFKQSTGQTPSAFRERHGGGADAP